MAQQSKLGKTATRIHKSGDQTVIFYHNTMVVQFNEGVIVLDSDGYRTATTKLRMNQASNQFGLGFSVWQKNGDWFISYKGETIEFFDHIYLNR